MHQCDECGALTKLTTGPYTTRTVNFGIVEVPGIPQYRCDACGAVDLPAGAASQVDAYLGRAEADAIARLPVGKFIDSAESTLLLGVSKQAFSKNRRVRRGFIYSRDVGKFRLYYEPSVEAFKSTQDGRIKLEWPYPISMAVWSKGIKAFNVELAAAAAMLSSKLTSSLMSRDAHFSVGGGTAQPKVVNVRIASALAAAPVCPATVALH